MNHIYKTVYNASLGTWVAVSELATGKHKTSKQERNGVSYCTKIAKALLLPPLLFSSSVYALPTGNQLVAGQATVATPTSTQMQINQTSNRAVINWQGFSVGQNEAVHIQQPNQQAALLNRVVGQDASQIQGKIQANGQVYLVNPNGVLFGKTAQVDVGGLIASTHDIKNDDFMNGKNHFTQSREGAKIENQGTINITNGGVVALIGEQVTNTGTINTPKGTTALAAGKTIDLDMKGDGLVEVKVTEAALNAQIENHGAITANGGRVVMTAKAANSLMDTVINQNGIVKARGLVERNGEIILDGGNNGAVKVSGTLDAQGEKGGHVHVAGNSIELNNTAIVDASGKTQGGQVTIGDKQTTVQVTLKQDSTINANATDNGNAGRIDVLADMDKGQVNVEGNIHAQALKQGNGGFIDTSAAKVKVADSAKISTKATDGNNGTWLIDPTDFNIGGANSNISGSVLSSNLANGSVTIASTSGTTGTSGDVNVYETVNWSANKLTLNAQGSIVIYADLNGTNNAQLAFLYGQSSPTGDQNPFVFKNGAKVNLAAGQNFSTQLGTAGPLYNYTVITDLGVQGDAINAPTTMSLQGINTGLSGFYVLGADIDARSSKNWNNGAGFTPIGSTGAEFTGAFFGLGHTITGLTVNLPNDTTKATGLFGNTQYATIANLNLAELNITGHTNVGGLVGLAQDSFIRDIYVSGTVSGNSKVGGVAGQTQGNTQLLYSSADVKVTGNTEVGGLIGNNAGTASDLYATGLVTGDSSVGGLIGINTGRLTEAYATGNVIGNNAVGGLVGVNQGGAINNTYALGNVKGVNKTGALVGENIGTSVGGTVANSFWNSQTQTNGVNVGIGSNVNGIVANVLAKTTKELQTLSTFTDAGWNISNQGGTDKIWRIYEGYTTPLLRVFLAPLTITADNTSSTYNGLAYNGGLVNASYNPSVINTTRLFNTGTPYANAINAGTYTPSIYSNQKGYDVKIVNGTLTINKAPLTISANDIIKTYGVNYLFKGTEFSTLGLVNGETIGNVNLSSTGAAANANVANSPYNILISNAQGGTFNPNNYNINYTDGRLTINKAPLTISANDIIKIYGLSYIFEGTEFSSLGLVNGETIDQVKLSSNGAAAKAKFWNSPYDINISNAQGSTFDPKNYDITYKTGKLIVQPNPLDKIIVIGGIDVDYIDNITRRGNSNNYVISGVLNNVVRMGDNIFVRLGRSNNFRLINSSSGDFSISSDQLSRLFRAYRLLGFSVVKGLIPFISPLQNSTTQTTLPDESVILKDGVLVGFEDVDTDFGQYGMCYAKVLGHGHYKAGKKRWSEKKHHHKHELKRYYDDLFFIIDGNGIKLPEGTLVFIPNNSDSSSGSTSDNSTDSTSL